MTISQSDERTPRRPLRLWPGVAAVVLQWLIILVVPLMFPDVGGGAILGGLAAALIVLVWWLFFSRAPWRERVAAIVLMIVAVLATLPLLHDSIRLGFMGMMFYLYVIPALSLALVAWAVVSRHLSGVPRLASMAVAILLACGVFTVLRTDGITGDADSDFEWRWTPTPEERLLAQAGDDSIRYASVTRVPAPAVTETSGKALPGEVMEKPAAPAHAPAAATAPEKRVAAPTGNESGARAADPGATRAAWPGFRGPRRDGVIRGVRIETDWSRTPPVELWRRPIGPGWSSFAVHGDLVYTQEQRGEEEIVACYRLGTGEPVWVHRDGVRFWESNGGPGPRATPAVSKGHVYTFGATGILNALNAATGAVVWSRNAATDTGTEIPGWGFASSPLVIDDLVVVAVAGQLAAYDAATGAPRWYGPTGGSGYSSPHAVTIDGVDQILLLRGSRTISVSPSDGALLWEHTWQPGVGIVQPALVADRDVLITTGDSMGGLGIRRIAATRGSSGWRVQERWTTRGLKPYFNDFVVHENHAFGFDGSIMACIDLENGERRWKGGRYGHGQVVVLPDQDLLLVLSEEGELALVSATPETFTELARFKAIEGKTWNHPVLVGDTLLVRNGEEMAAFRLPRARR
jgi:outer membrane protein assembly factor BamB